MLRPQGTITSRFAGKEAYRPSPHTGIDFVYGFKKPHYAIADGLIYKVMGKGNPDLMSYRNIYQICDTPTGLYEIAYVHCWDMNVAEGDYVVAGQPIMTEGNTGDMVYVGNDKVQAWEKPSGKGSHLHLSVRPIERVKKLKTGEHYLNALKGKRYQQDGYYFHIINNDENNGWIDFESMLEKPTNWYAIIISVLKNISSTLAKT